ncbi:MAG: acyl-ACP--UDP-N-acetylglucosamine O-acyltransferase [Brachymonas sp.]|nr:acyl-ACP--UDP-N-acetylglucosamine O-acyltransferase [Brachymonas sp.]
MAHIHPTALIDPSAQVAADATIGAFTLIGPHVTIGARSVIGSHCVIEGHTTIGEDNRIYSHNAIGGAPQDKKYAGEPTRLEIGHRNTIREFCTINTGTVQDSGCTRVGDDNWIMSSVHIAHDVQVGNQTILASYVGLAGHVQVHDWAIIGGQSGIHQFCRVGAHAMLGSNSAVNQDIPPYMLVDGNPGKPRSFNIEGLRRRGFSPNRIAAIKAMHKYLYRDGLPLEQARAAIDALAIEYSEADDDIRRMLDFLVGSKRGIVR